MPKGDRRKRITCFRKGHAPYNRGYKLEDQPEKDPVTVKYVRPSSSKLKAAEESPIFIGALASNHATDTDAETEEMTPQVYKPLRPVSDHASTTNADDLSLKNCSEGYKTFHTGKLWEMFNKVTAEHYSHVGGVCQGKLGFAKEAEQKWGFGWREKVKCDRCGYSSAMFKLYEEVEQQKRGRKAATINMGINLAMTQTPAGPTSVRKIFHGGNIPAPSRAAMQKTARKVSKVLVQANANDMKERREKLKRIKRLRNSPEHQIAVQSDGVYNNALNSAVTRNPFQPATQMVYTVAENETNQHEILAVETVNKCCSKHGFHEQEDEECDMKCAPCSSTACMEVNIGDEQRWAKYAFESLREDGLEVNYITTDPDTSAHRALDEMYCSGVTKTKSEYQVDTRHLSRNHRKYVRQSEKALQMMPARLKSVRVKLRANFALDISHRCHAEIQKIHSDEQGKFSNISARVAKCIDAMVKCYGGDHSRCAANSTMCKGTLSDNWPVKSVYLQRSFKINILQHEETLRDCINYRLGPERLRLTRLNTNSQKVEGTNRAIKRSLPKDVTYTRNFEGRAHSAIHSVNNGPGQSLIRLLDKAGCSIPEGGRVCRALASEQRFSEEKKKREKSIISKCRRKMKRLKLFHLYSRHQEKRNYIKGLLRRSKQCTKRAQRVLTGNPKATRSSIEHNYSK